MIDIKFLREDPDAVRENMKKKFQDHKLPLVDEVLALDKENRQIKGEVEAL
ncbi:MAG: serine--tRNA ligase, partial [Lachnospiraceae bacterium]|nr:serine--tRNA ligase [Lachnospiraceae bacterium]